MRLLAVWLGKLTLLALAAGSAGGATRCRAWSSRRSFPGFLPRAMAGLPQGVVVVSGTNGKTTTTKMVATILSERYRVLTNDTGSNFVRGAITATVEHSTLDRPAALRRRGVRAGRGVGGAFRGRRRADARACCSTSCATSSTASARSTPPPPCWARSRPRRRRTVVLNRDDQRIAALADADIGGGQLLRGESPSCAPSFPNDEELYGGELHVSSLPAAAELIALPGAAGEPTVLRIGERTETFVLRASGPHNAQNAAGAAALALSLGLGPDEIARGLNRIEPAFGRGQTFTVDGRSVVLHLVKNPAGFRQSLRTLDTSRPGRDPDRDQRRLRRRPGRVLAVGRTVRRPARAPRARITTSGTRAADMAVRLRYDDVAVDAVRPDLEVALRAAVDSVAPGGEVAVFSTYTAMWSLHATLTRTGVAA